MSGPLVLREELARLIGDCCAELEGIRGMKGPTDRVDAYCALLRGVLTRSTLCTVGGRVRWWDGRCYRPVSVGDLSSVVGNILADMGVGATDVRRIGTMPYGVLRDKEREADAGLIGFENGVYDMGSGSLLPFSEELVVLWDMPYRCDPERGCPKWDGFLREVLPDPLERDCLQEFFGMCFLDRTGLSIEKMALLVGSGANGKSVVCEVMRGVIGPSRVSDLSPDQLASDKMVAELEGKALNFAPDVRRGAAFDSALKALASSQQVTGWRLYSGAVKVKCPPLAFALNELPWFRDVTPAFLGQDARRDDSAGGGPGGLQLAHGGQAAASRERRGVHALPGDGEDPVRAAQGRLGRGKPGAAVALRERLERRPGVRGAGAREGRRVGDMAGAGQVRDADFHHAGAGRPRGEARQGAGDPVLALPS